MDDDKTRCCGNCELCVHTYLGSECGLNDNPVDDNQAACIDYIPGDWFMKDKAFNNSVQAEIEAAKLRELYDRLDDEATPYEMGG